jgi:hypothetical protein
MVTPVGMNFECTVPLVFKKAMSISLPAESTVLFFSDADRFVAVFRSVILDNMLQRTHPAFVPGISVEKKSSFVPGTSVQKSSSYVPGTIVEKN